MEGFTVTFTDLSIDASSINWDFGDGTNSNEIVTEHTYSTEGEYTVLLSSTNDCGTDTISKVIVIEAPISADFSADVIQGCPGLVVSYSDETDGDAVSWEWLFEGGDPATASAQHPEITYNDPGTFTTTLIVTNELGSTDYDVASNLYSNR